MTSSGTTQTTSRSSSLAALARAVGIGGGIALAANLAVYAVARLTGDGLVVAPAGQAAAGVPVGAVVGSTVFATLAALLGLLVLRRLPRAHTWLLVLATVAVLASFVIPFGAAQQTSTALWLCLMHVTTAVPLVLAALRVLPDRNR